MLDGVLNFLLVAMIVRSRNEGDVWRRLEGWRIETLLRGVISCYVCSVEGCDVRVGNPFIC